MFGSRNACLSMDEEVDRIHRQQTSGDRQVLIECADSRIISNQILVKEKLTVNNSDWFPPRVQQAAVR